MRLPFPLGQSHPRELVQFLLKNLCSSPLGNNSSSKNILSSSADRKYAEGLIRGHILTGQGGCKTAGLD